MLQRTILFASSLKPRKDRPPSANTGVVDGWAHAPQYVKQIIVFISLQMGRIFFAHYLVVLNKAEKAFIPNQFV